MSQLAQYERDALDMALRIRELKSLTPQFLDARDQAQRAVERHYKLIEDGIADLEVLRAEAAQLAMRLGALEDEAPETFEEEPVEMVEVVEPTVEEPLITASFAEVITAKLADMSINDPAELPVDRSGEPEMTTPELEQIEANMAEALKAYG